MKVCGVLSGYRSEVGKKIGKNKTYFVLCQKIYSQIHHDHHILVWAWAPWVNHTIYPYQPSLSTGLLDCTQYPHKPDVSKSLLPRPCLGVPRKNRSRFRPCFTSSVLFVLSILLGCFLRLEVSGRTADGFRGLLPGFVQNSTRHSYVAPI